MAVLAGDARVLAGDIIGKTECGPDAFILELQLPAALEPVTAGRFAMLSPSHGGGPVIPRPFSIYEQPGSHTVSFLVQVLGPGTRALEDLEVGESVDCTLPLGQGFDPPPASRELVMVAGGVGSAPFLAYGRERVRQGAVANTTYLFGARTEDRLYDRARFEAEPFRTILATDDGSLGYSGSVLDSLADELEAGAVSKDALFCACGPEGLLHAFADFCAARGLEGQISLETYMGCGFGVCNACPVPTRPDGPLGNWPWAKSCLEGPVFSLEAVSF